MNYEFGSSNINKEGQNTIYLFDFIHRAVLAALLLEGL